jgi:hypothetical protein
MIGERDGAKHEIDILGRADRRRRRISDEQTRDRSADKHRVCQQLFTEPLPMDRGSIVLPPGYWPSVDPAVVAASTLRTRRFTRSVSSSS